MKFEQFSMRNRHDQIYAVTAEEKLRRIELVKKVMREKEVEVFLLADCADSLGCWLCGTAYPALLVVPLEGDMIKIYPAGSSNPDTRAFVRVQEDPLGMCRQEEKPDWEQIARLVARCDGRIGTAGLENMDVQMYEQLTAAVPDLQPVDIGYDINIVRAEKSPFEQELLWESARMHQKILEAVPALLRPGRTMKEVSDDLRYLALEFGSTGEDMCLMIHTLDKEGIPLDEVFEPFPGRYFGAEDIVSVLVETNGPGGFYHAIGRYFAFCSPTEQFMERYKVAVEANQLVGKMMYPGNTLRNVADTVNDFIRDSGYYTDDCCYLHGMGYAMWEFPAIADNTFGKQKLPYEDLVLKEGMVSLAHPHAGKPDRRFTEREEMIRCIDSYMVREGGAARMNTMTQDIIML